MKMALRIEDTILLTGGGRLPRLGLGVYQARSNECVNAVKTAIEAGYLHIDTAQGYRNEDLVGRGIAATPLSRSKLFITTKYMPSHQVQSVDDVYDQLVKSLKPLHRGPAIPPTKEGRKALAGGGIEKDPVEPYIDLFLIHAPWGGEKGRSANWAALARAQKEGWVKDIGVSNFGIKHLESLSDPVPAVNQIELHPWCQQKPIVEYCLKRGIALQAYCPLVRADKKRFQDPVLQAICQKTGKGPAQVLIRWSIQKGYAALPKSVTPERIRSNADVYDFELDEGDMQKLDGLDEGDKGACSWNPIHAD